MNDGVLFNYHHLTNKDHDVMSTPPLELQELTR